jgi:hypothetical protein
MNPTERASLIEQYANGYDALRTAWDDLPSDVRKWKPSESDWSAHEIVVHCADSESYAAIRIRLLVAEPDPVIIGYDQEAWVKTFGYPDQSTDLALDVVRAVRAYTTPVLRALPERAWAAVGTHTESGQYSAEDWLRTYAAHLHDHAEQIQSNYQRWLIQSGNEPT